MCRKRCTGGDCQHSLNEAASAGGVDGVRVPPGGVAGQFGRRAAVAETPDAVGNLRAKGKHGTSYIQAQIYRHI